ncbi:DUF5590 domain-containing protein [Virgibacillus soli]
MKNYYQFEKQKSNRLIWLLSIVALVLISCLVFSIWLYHSILVSKETGFLESEQIAKKEANIETVESIERFHGNQLYHVVSGSTKDHQKLIVFIPKSKDGKKQALTVVHQSDVKSKDVILKKWMSSCNECRFVDIKPGIVNKESIWEITYYDHSGRYVFEYFTMEDGTLYEQLRLRPSLHK